MAHDVCHVPERFSVNGLSRIRVNYTTNSAHVLGLLSHFTAWCFQLLYRGGKDMDSRYAVPVSLEVI